MSAPARPAAHRGVAGLPPSIAIKSILPFGSLAGTFGNPPCSFGRNLDCSVPSTQAMPWRTASKLKPGRAPLKLFMSHLRKKGRRTVMTAENSQLSRRNLPSWFQCSLGRYSGIRGRPRGFLCIRAWFANSRAAHPNRSPDRSNGLRDSLFQHLDRSAGLAVAIIGTSGSPAAESAVWVAS